MLREVILQALAVACIMVNDVVLSDGEPSHDLGDFINVIEKGGPEFITARCVYGTVRECLQPYGIVRIFTQITSGIRTAWRLAEKATVVLRICTEIVRTRDRTSWRHWQHTWHSPQ